MATHSRARTPLEKMSIVYGEATPSGAEEWIPSQGCFRNRRMEDKYLSSVYPAGFAPQRCFNPPKYKHFSEVWTSEGTREYIPVVSKPHSYQSRAKTPGSPGSPVRKSVGDEFRHVAGPYFKQLDIDDSVNFPAAPSVVDLESTLIPLSLNKSGSLPSLPSTSRVLRSKTNQDRSYMGPRSTQTLKKVTGHSTMVKLSSGPSLISEGEHTILRQVLSYQNQNLLLNVVFVRLEDAVESSAPAHLNSNNPKTKTLPYEYSFSSLLKIVAAMLREEAKGKKREGRFTVEIKFFKESEMAWIPLNTELQWIHAKSIALDNEDNRIEIMYGARNESDILQNNRMNRNDRLVLSTKSKLDVHLTLNTPNAPPPLVEANSSVHSFGTDAELSVALHHTDIVANTSLLFNDSISSVQHSRREKQKMMADNLESRLVKKLSHCR